MTENQREEDILSFDDDFLKNMSDMEFEAGIATKIKQSDLEPKKKEKSVVVVTKNEGVNAKKKKSIIKPNEENLEIDDNYFLLEGVACQFYETSNKAICYVKIISKKITEDGRVILNFPQVKIFPSNRKAWEKLKKIKPGDYVRVKGQIIPSYAKKTGTDESTIQTSFVVRSIQKTVEPIERRDPLFEKYGISTFRQSSRKTNLVIVSGTISNIRIKNAHCIKIRMNCVMNKGIVPVLLTYYSDDYSKVVPKLYEGNHIGVIGEIRTSKRKGKTDMESIYFQDICALEIGESQKKENKEE